MTPQVARMDAHQLRREWPTRLCYAGPVLHTRSDPLEKNRSPMQIGAELYGHGGLESDVEVIRLMLEMLSLSGVLYVHLDLGHVGIFRSLSRQADLNKAEERTLFDILQRKARPELEEFVVSLDVIEDIKSMLMCLAELNGGQDVIGKAITRLVKAGDPVKQALAELEMIAKKLMIRFPSLPVSFDLAELRGYHYHTGVVFAAFAPVVGKEIARGGRYDNIGAIFGRARPATGFSADLKLLAQLGKQANQDQPEERIFAPYSDDAGLLDMIRDVRAQGRIVIQQLPEQKGGAQDMGCNAELIQDNNRWAVKPLT
jgi:ATP phosphoribosyltransferase regulatory subunit